MPRRDPVGGPAEIFEALPGWTSPPRVHGGQGHLGIVVRTRLLRETGAYMTSSLAWLDYSERERRKVLDVVNLFRDRNTVDELGVGTVRDTSRTSCSRNVNPAYPHSLRPLHSLDLSDDREVESKVEGSVVARAPAPSWPLMDALAESEDGEGTIGISARQTLKTFPSTIYWATLRDWGIRAFRGSQGEYHRWLVSLGGRLETPVTTDDGDPLDVGAGGGWHARVPLPPVGFPREASFRMRRDEAEYVRERIAMRAPDSLMTLLLTKRVNTRAVEQPWHLPAVVDLPQQLQRQLRHAANFSLVINGAPLLYNLMLEEMTGAAPERSFRDRLAEWAAEIEDSRAVMDAWDRSEFWDLVRSADSRVTPLTRQFIDRWLKLVLDDGPGSIPRQSTRPQSDQDAGATGQGRAGAPPQRAGPQAVERRRRHRSARLQLADHAAHAGRRRPGSEVEGRLMLEPQDRSLMLESLRPPEGFELSHAVGTTFTLDLLALLSAPLAFTMFETASEGGAPDPVALLKAVREYAERITVFCQGGQIFVPPHDQLLYSHLEESVVEVTQKQGLFHPKVWAMRFIREGARPRYRVLCMSRNLTFDRSWDTLLRLDGELTRRKNAIARNHPLGDFVAELPRLAASRLTRPRRVAIEQIGDELRRVDFELPEHVQDIQFWPLGIRNHRRWPFGQKDGLLVVSPFIGGSDASTTGRVERAAGAGVAGRVDRAARGPCRSRAL